VIDDPALARERFVGLFQTNEPESFAAAVAATLGAVVSDDPHDQDWSRSYFLSIFAR
jgi:transmembrane sensor